MRILSQDGTIDVPYDCFSLTIATGKYEDMEVASIYCYNLSSPKGTKLAKYSSKEKAEKAMEMLREQYMKLGMIKILASGTCEYIDKSLEKEEKMEIYTDYCRKHCFKFPSDEDVKV